MYTWMWGDHQNRERLTEINARAICDFAIPQDLQEILKLDSANRQEVPFWKQFFYRNKYRLLRHSLEETQYLALEIYEYSKQDILKFKLAKQKLEELQKPENFYLTKATGTVDYSNIGITSKEGMEGHRGDKGLMVSRGDVISDSQSKSIGRGGASAFNEEFANIEEKWQEKNLALKAESKKLNASLLEVNTGTKIDLDNISINPITLEESRREIVPEEEEEEGRVKEKEVSYTNISLSNSADNTSSTTLNSAKSFNNSKVDVKVNKDLTSVNTTTKQVRTVGNEFVINDATYKALSKYVSNFRESFLASFESLFIHTWYN